MCWGLAYVFDKKRYLTRDLVDADFVPKDLKLPKPAPEHEPPKQPTSRSKQKKASEHVQLSRIAGRRVVSIANCFECGHCNV